MRSHSEHGRGPVTARAARPRTFPEALACALRGVAHAARTQRHFRAHLVLAAGALLAAVAARFSAVELGILVATIGLVLAAELLNTAVEMLTDLVVPGEDARAAAIKDVSAAAVLAASACAAAAGAWLFLPRLVGASPLLTRGLPAFVAAVFLAAFLAGTRRAAGSPGPPVV